MPARNEDTCVVFKIDIAVLMWRCNHKRRSRKKVTNQDYGLDATVVQRNVLLKPTRLKCTVLISSSDTKGLKQAQGLQQGN